MHSKNRYEKMSKFEQLVFLTKNFSLSLKEAQEIHSRLVKDLPFEIRGYFK